MGNQRRERKREHFYRMAKKAGYRSRAAWKLQQLDERYGLFHRGDVVVDLGAAPGGWLQVAGERVGDEGFVLGVDIQRIARLPYKNVETMVADIIDVASQDLIKAKLPGPADIVLSDASPKISGVWDVDHVRSIELARAVLLISEKILKPEGRLIVKVFQGLLLNDFVGEVRQRFDFVKITKPVASRKGSAEIYIIAKNFRQV